MPPSPTYSDLDASFVLVGPDNVRVTPSSQSDTSFAHDWSRKATGGIRIAGRHFVDAQGRVLGLRGVNLSGACKTPTNDNNLTFPDDHESVTFVGRPFPLDEAHEHFARLRRWGLTFVRFLVTWEALEHEGPGKYDTEYLAYLHSLLSLLPQYGISAFISLHQDVWSRYSGGSGAPAWTLTLAGLDLHALEDTGAAWLKGVQGGGHVESERGLWPCGYQKLAAATLATCFWAGNTFAPKLLVDDGDGGRVSVQTFLQGAFLGAWEVLVRAVGQLDGVIGFEMMNEPHRGYVELPSLHGFDYRTDLHLSHVPSALQSFTLGAGHPTLVPVWTRSFPKPTSLTSHALLNTSGTRVWRADGPTSGQCLWEWHGVWGWDRKKNEAVVLRENYFVKDPATGRKIDWYTDFYYPFVKQWAERVRTVAGKDKIVFTEAIPNEFCPSSWTTELRPPNMAYAPHWYDLNALFAKAFGDFSVNVQGLSRGMFPLKAFYWGHKGARDNFVLQLRNIVEAGYKALGEVPIIIGECGVPMDMNQKESFKTDDWTWQMRMMDAMITGLERSLVGYTLWNYNPYNDDERGDHWNGENFSWFSRRRALPSSMLVQDQSSAGLDQGARALRAIVRPYPAKTAGIPLHFEYDMNTGRTVFEWATPLNTPAPSTSSTIAPPLTLPCALTTHDTELFVPAMLAHGRKVNVEGMDGGRAVYDEATQTLLVRPKDVTPGQRHRIVVSLDPPLKEAFEVNTFWGDFGPRIYAALVVLLGVIAFILVG